MEQNHTQALALLEKAQDVGGDEGFWYHLTMTMVKTTVDLRGQDTDTKVRATPYKLQPTKSALF